MFNPNQFKIVGALLASAFVLVACDKDDEQVDASAAVDAGGSILQYVPADSPYVFATLTPLPDDVMDNLEPKIDRVLAAYQSILKEMVKAKQAQMSPAERNSEEAQRVTAFVDELSTLLSLEGLRGAGLTRESRGAFYGNGLLPVLRLELSDGELFENKLADLEGKAGKQMLTGEVGGQSYRYFDAEELRIVVAVVEDQAVVSLMPSAFDDSQTGRALGLAMPAEDITSTGILEALIEDYSYTDNFVGFVDVPQIVESFVGEPTGLDADLMALMDADSPQLSNVCKDELRQVAGVAPRLVVGYTDVSATRFDSNLVIEMREDLASELKSISAAVPGLGGDPGGLMSFGMSLDIGAARSFIEARLDAMEADPYECEHLADLQAGVSDMRASLNQPVPPMVYDFRGFLAVIDDIEGLDVATQTPPTSVDGSFLLAMDNAQALLAMGAMFSPELAALNLQPGGDPVELDIPQLAMMGISGWAALTNEAVAVSIGEGAESEVQSVLAAEASDPSPFMSFSMDAARYYNFIGDAVAAGEAADDEEATEGLLIATQEMMSAVGDLYDRMAADVVFTDNGIEVRMVETLKE